ncbi:MAG: baseplate J/gp47 family protein [Anaerolineaceae bacterium]
MKTQVILLEAHDDIISTRDKMTWGKAARILLIFPEKHRILARKLDLVLIQRHATSLGARVGLVVRDPVVREHADELDIPVFRSRLEAQRATWRHGRGRVRHAFEHVPHGDLRAERDILHPTRSTWMENNWFRAAAFLLGVLAVFSMAVVYLPSAEVEINPKSELRSADLPITTGKKVTTFNLSGRIPWQTLKVTVSGSDHTSTTGSVPVPAEKANGKVIFTNLGDAVVKIPAGTVLRSDDETGAEFITLHEGSLAAGNGQNLLVNVEALNGGSTGNVPAGAIQMIDGNLGLSVSVTNPDAMQGGTDRTAPAPAPADQRLLYSRLEKTLLNQALTRMQAQIEAGDLLIKQTLAVSRVIHEECEPSEGQPGDQLSLSLELEVEVNALPAAQINQLAGAALGADLPTGMTLMEDTLVMEPPSQWKTTADGSLQGILTVKQKISPDVNGDDLARIIRGQRVDQAAQQLEQRIVLQSPPVFRIKPGWWQRLPFLPFQISIITAK